MKNFNGQCLGKSMLMPSPGDVGLSVALSTSGI
jgi:hypothetical protein